MIKVDKDLEDIPASLNSQQTNDIRDRCISSATYIKSRRYKLRDVKDKLNSIYKNKCAYCEQKVHQTVGDDNQKTVEHYRPKSKYYWLAYSWDNLLLCCYRCNNNKADNFRIKNSEVTIDESYFRTKIHKISQEYNLIEKPFMIHPEFENVLEHIQFNKYGEIFSNDARVNYTIETCGLNRDELNEKRKAVIDEFKNKINAYTLENKATKSIFEELLQDIRDKNREFIAFRFWILKNYKSVLSPSSILSSFNEKK